jgi:hypothetical protein
MPSIVGSINIVSMDHSSVVNLNESVILSPKSTSKSSNGSGTGNTANFMKFINISPNATNTNEPHISDQNIADADIV